MKNEWDIETITAGDYTVEWKINPMVYKNWDKGRKNHDEPEGVAFQRFVKENVEKCLNDHMETIRKNYKYYSMEFTDEKEREKELNTLKNKHELLNFDFIEENVNANIAMISFAYDNGQIIKKLQQRGDAIKLNRFDTVRAIEQEIENSI